MFYADATERTYTASNTHCQATGGTLATINREYENSMSQSLLSSNEIRTVSIAMAYSSQKPLAIVSDVLLKSGGSTFDI